MTTTDWILLIGVPISALSSFITMTRLARDYVQFRSERRKRLRGQVDFGIVYGWDALKSILLDANDSVQIMQTWLPQSHRMSNICEEVLESTRHKEVKVELLLADHDIAGHRDVCRVDSEDPKDPHLGWSSTISLIWNLADKYNCEKKLRIEGRFYSCLPMCPMYIIDRKTILWGLYDPFRESITGKMFRTDMNTEVGRFLSMAFKNLWDEMKGNCQSGGKELPNEKKFRCDELVKNKSND